MRFATSTVQLLAAVAARSATTTSVVASTTTSVQKRDTNKNKEYEGQYHQPNVVSRTAVNGSNDNWQASSSSTRLSNGYRLEDENGNRRRRHRRRRLSNRRRNKQRQRDLFDTDMDDFLRECIVTTEDVDADVGILQCGYGQYCKPYDYDDDSDSDTVEQDGAATTTTIKGQCVDSVEQHHDDMAVTPTDLVQQQRRLEAFVCPSANCPGIKGVDTDVFLGAGDSLTCMGPTLSPCEDFDVRLDNGAVLNCNSEIKFDQPCNGVEVLQTEGTATIYCIGYQACFGNYVYFLTDNDATIQCLSPFACDFLLPYMYGSSIVQCVVENACDGDSGVFITNGVDRNEAKDGILHCQATRSCNNIYVADETTAVVCDAPNACEYIELDYNSLPINPILCIQADSCASVTGYEFRADFDFTQPYQVVGTPTTQQYLTVCTILDPAIAANLDFGKGLVCVDTDDDGINDFLDNCPGVPNPDQLSTMIAGVGNACVGDTCRNRNTGKKSGNNDRNNRGKRQRINTGVGRGGRGAVNEERSWWN